METSIPGLFDEGTSKVRKLFRPTFPPKNRLNFRRSARFLLGLHLAVALRAPVPSALVAALLGFACTSFTLQLAREMSFGQKILSPVATGGKVVCVAARRISTLPSVAGGDGRILPKDMLLWLGPEESGWECGEPQRKLRSSPG